MHRWVLAVQAGTGGADRLTATGVTPGVWHTSGASSLWSQGLKIWIYQRCQAQAQEIYQPLMAVRHVCRHSCKLRGQGSESVHTWIKTVFTILLLHLIYNLSPFPDFVGLFPFSTLCLAYFSTASFFISHSFLPSFLPSLFTPYLSIFLSFPSFLSLNDLEA